MSPEEFCGAQLGHPDSAVILLGSYNYAPWGPGLATLLSAGHQGTGESPEEDDQVSPKSYTPALRREVPTTGPADAGSQKN